MNFGAMQNLTSSEADALAAPPTSSSRILMEGAAVLAIFVEWMLGLRVAGVPTAEIRMHFEDLTRIRLVHRWTEVRAMRIDLAIARYMRLHAESLSRVLLGCMRAAFLVHGNIFGLEIPPMLPEIGEYRLQDVELERDGRVPRTRDAALAIQAEADGMPAAGATRARARLERRRYRL
jgi:hypothetical protein